MRFFTGLLYFLSALMATHGAGKKSPDIVLILADDAGYSDFGCYGGEIETPVLDSLAAGGLRFSQFYNTGRCCPSRAAMLTGVYQHQAGMGHMARDRGIPGYRGTILPDVPTLAERLKKGGYRTMMTGKWHLGINHQGQDRRGDLFVVATLGELGRSGLALFNVSSPTWPPDRVTGGERLGDALRPGPVAIATLAPQRWPRPPDSRLLPTAPSSGGRHPPAPVTPERSREGAGRPAGRPEAQPRGRLAAISKHLLSAFQATWRALDPTLVANNVFATRSHSYSRSGRGWERERWWVT